MEAHPQQTGQPLESVADLPQPKSKLQISPALKKAGDRIKMRLEALRKGREQARSVPATAVPKLSTTKTQASPQKKLWPVLVAVLILMPIFLYMGFQQNFPGTQISQTIQAQIEAQFPYPVTLSETKLENFGLTIDRIAVLPQPGMTKFPIAHLIEFRNIRFSFLSVLTGSPKVTANAHQGRWSLTSSVANPDKIALEIKGLQLSQIPWMNLIPYALVNGQLDFNANLRQFIQPLQTGKGLPQGRLSLQLRNARLQARNLEAVLPNMTLPPVNLKLVNTQVSLDDLIQLELMQVVGDLSGEASGQIKLNERNPLLSRYKLGASFRFDPKLEQELSDLVTFLSIYRCKDDFRISVEGLFNRFTMPKKEKCP